MVNIESLSIDKSSRRIKGITGMLRYALLAITILCSSNSMAESDKVIRPGITTTSIYGLSRAISPHKLSFIVNETTTQLGIDINTSISPDNISIIDPDGYVIPATNIEGYTQEKVVLPFFNEALFFMGITEGEHAKVNIDDPKSGTWSVSLVLPSSAGNKGGIRVSQKGTLYLDAKPTSLTYKVTEPVVINAEVSDSGEPVLDSDVLAEIYQFDARSSSQSISLYDDGVYPDINSGDGIYAGSISGLSTGYYRADIGFQGGIPTISSATEFEVVPITGIFTGNVSDIGVDANDDGLIDRIDISFEVDIRIPETYSLQAVLKQGENTLISGTQEELDSGINTMTVSFLDKDIKEYLISDGPYLIHDVMLKQGGSWRPVDRRADFGQTQPYSIEDLQRPLTIILDGMTDTALDKNGDGKFDELRIVFQVDILQPGEYTWSASIRHPDAVQAMATAINSGRLSKVGINKLSLSFDGAEIAKSGLSGPYLLGGLGIYGPPNAAALKLDVGQTAEYSCGQFE